VGTFIIGPKLFSRGSYMTTKLSTRTLSLFAIIFSSGCAEEPIDGFIWEIDLVGTIDGCNNPVVGYQTTSDYRLSFEGSDVSLAIGADEFANGTISGCQVAYQTVVWGEDREINGEPHEIKWQITGEAIFRQGGDTCNLPVGTDWIGTETSTIVDSTTPSLEVGCTYIVETTGSYVGQASAIVAAQ
jgi:hypothetical protein